MLIYPLSVIVVARQVGSAITAAAPAVPGCLTMPPCTGFERRRGTVPLIAHALDKLGRFSELVAFLRKVVARFPDVPMLHHDLSVALVNNSLRERDAQEKGDMLEEAARHALRAVQLEPDQYRYVSGASVVLARKRDHPSSLRYGKQALALASTDEEKIQALRKIADVHADNGLYADARKYLRQALQIDDSNVDVIGDMAHCFDMEGNCNEAFRMVKQGLMLDPHNVRCQDIQSRWKKLGAWFCR